MVDMVFVWLMQKGFHTYLVRNFNMWLNFILGKKEQCKNCVHWLGSLCRVVYVSSVLFTCHHDLLLFVCWLGSHYGTLNNCGTSI